MAAIEMNEKILNVINAVLAYKKFYCSDCYVKGIFPEDWFEKTQEYYKSLDLPEGMKKNNADFECVLNYADTSLLTQLNNTYFSDLHNFHWKNEGGQEPKNIEAPVYEVPSYEQIKEDYNLLMATVGNVKTIGDLKEVCKKYPLALTAEINDMSIDNFVASGGRDEDIECIWYRSFGCLNYIYFNRGFSEPSFDVTAPNFPSTRLEGVTMSELTEEYYNNAIAEVSQHGDVGRLIKNASDKVVKQSVENNATEKDNAAPEIY